MVRVFYTTPGYFDYNWTVRTDLDRAPRKKITYAFLALNKDIRRQGHPGSAARYALHTDQGRKLRRDRSRPRKTPAC